MLSPSNQCIIIYLAVIQELNQHHQVAYSKFYTLSNSKHSQPIRRNYKRVPNFEDIHLFPKSQQQNVATALNRMNFFF